MARAYKVLSDPLLRAAYDADLHSQPTCNVSSSPAPQPEPVARSAQSKPAYADQDNGEFMAGYGIDPESLSRVKKGEASLAKAFWYYTVLLPVAWFIVSLTVFSIFSPSQNFFNNITGSSMLAICGYSLFYSMPAIWRSSRHSSVSPFWRRTTKAVTILLLVCFILTAFLLGVYASAQRSVSKNSSFTSGDVAQENRIDLASAVLDKNQSSTKEYPVKTTAPWDEFKPEAEPIKVKPAETPTAEELAKAIAADADKESKAGNSKDDSVVFMHAFAQGGDVIIEGKLNTVGDVDEQIAVSLKSIAVPELMSESCSALRKEGISGSGLRFIYRYFNRNGVLIYSKIIDERECYTYEAARKIPTPSSAAKNETDQHYAAIYAAHPDADNIVKGSEFKAWISSLKSDWRQEYERVLKEGTTEQVIAMLNSYKTSGYATARLKQNKAASNQAAQYQEPQINSCVFKGVMTKADYDACGITPP